jgi:NAD-dependent DNA ligase
MAEKSAGNLVVAIGAQQTRRCGVIFGLGILHVGVSASRAWRNTSATRFLDAAVRRVAENSRSGEVVGRSIAFSETRTDMIARYSAWC